MDYQTSFERKKRKLGLPIFRARWKRRAPQGNFGRPTGGTLETAQ
jgi:hypothetical protein